MRGADWSVLLIAYGVARCIAYTMYAWFEARGWFG